MLRLERQIKKLGQTILIIAVLVAVIFPFYWTLISSFKPPGEVVSSNPTLIPYYPTLGNYKEVLGSAFLIFTKNSILVSIFSTLISTVLAIFAAYSIARLRYRGRALISRTSLLLYLFPTIVLIVPIFNLASKFGLVNSHLSLIVINVALTVPFTPGIVTVVFFVFITSWGEYLFAFLLMSREAKKTIPVGLNYWLSTYSISWGPLTASAILAIIPVLILFAVLGSFFVESLTAGAIKG